MEHLGNMGHVELCFVLFGDGVSVSFYLDLRVPLGASKAISEPMLRLAQTMHLSCTHTNTVSKRTETRFHTTHIT
jgi:hypothetical protein